MLNDSSNNNEAALQCEDSEADSRLLLGGNLDGEVLLK